jgi:hypothetical protein
MSDVLNPDVAEYAIDCLFGNAGTALASSALIVLGLLLCLRRR